MRTRSCASCTQVAARGLLLYGPRGAARHLSPGGGRGTRREFISVSFADIIDMFVAERAEHPRAVRDRARNAPCVLFWTSLTRSGRASQLRTPDAKAVNQLLLELDDVREQ